MGLAEPEAPALEQGFFEMGLDSLMALEMKAHLGNSLGRNIPSTVVFQYPTIELLADYLLQDALPQPSEPVAPTASDELDGLSEDELLALLDDEVTRSQQALAPKGGKTP
jgi:acyl carrier protein